MLSRDRSGFTLLELVVALVVMTILLGALAPEAIRRLTQGQSATLATDLRALDTAIRGYQSDTGRLPRRLSYLAAPPPAGARDACDGTLPATARWRGPYLSRTISPTGLQAGGALIGDLLVREPATPTATRYGTLSVSASRVDREVADQLEAAFDGDADPRGGTIRWEPDGETGTLRYVMPVRGC
jgi:prepilin-type N-terminal cleavage/methylation domain-containing protein